MGDEKLHNGIETDAVLRAGINRLFDDYMRELSLSGDVLGETVILSPSEIARICGKLLLLPHEARYVLFGEYCFHMSYDSIHEMFGLKDPRGLSLWYKRLLANLADLEKNQFIADDSMQEICNKALEQYTSKFEREANQRNTVKLSFLRRNGNTIITKAVAAAAIILSVTFVGTVTVNADFRERVINWFIESFVDFSLFNTESEHELSIDEMKLYHPEYVPDRYRLTETYEIDNGVSFDYTDERGNMLIILITMPGDGLMVDTEGLDMTELEYGGDTAYYFYNKNESRFVFSKDGYPMYIIGNLDLDECVTIADGIKK